MTQAPIPRTPQAAPLARAEPEPQAIVMLRNPAMKMQLDAALPRHLTVERFIRMSATCVRQVPKLALCDLKSLLGAMFELAQLGLEPATPLGHAWILPYGSTAQVIIGYKGFISLADRSGIVMSAEVVFEGDRPPDGVFEYELGTKPFIKHTPTDILDARGALTHAYAVATWSDGRTLFKLVNRADIDRARNSSAAWKQGQQNKQKRDSPWFTNEESMWRKTVVRRLAPFLPMSAEFNRAMELDNRTNEGREQEFKLPPEVRLPVEAEATRLENEVDAAKSRMGTDRKGSGNEEGGEDAQSKPQ